MPDGIDGDAFCDWETAFRMLSTKLQGGSFLLQLGEWRHVLCYGGTSLEVIGISRTGRWEGTVS